MRVSLPVSLVVFDQATFAELDNEVMRLAFDTQRQLGRLCEEQIYQNELSRRLSAAGLAAEREVPVVVTHDDFKKTYLIDLLVANAGIFELKVATALSAEHESQLLDYLFLTGARHGKLINFRAPRIESRFFNAAPTLEECRRFSVSLSEWREHDEAGTRFRERLLALLTDWGRGLDLALYTEAMIHFMGGKSRVAQRLPLSCGDQRLGTQDFNMLNSETAFRLTAFTDEPETWRESLHALLVLSPLRRLQWVNLGRQEIRFVTVER